MIIADSSIKHISPLMKFCTQTQYEILEPKIQLEID